MNKLNIKTIGLPLLIWMILALACSQPFAGLLGSPDEAVDDAVRDPAVIAQATVELRADVRSTLGDLDKDHATVDIPQKTFDSDITLSMAYLSEPPGDGAAHFTPLGPTVALKVEGEQTRFNEPVRISLKFDPAMVNGPGDVYAAYYDEQYGWHYFLPDEVDMERGVMHFTTYHFSWWGAAQPTEEEIIDMFVNNQSTEQFVRQTHQDLANQQVEELVRQIMQEGMGVHDNRTIAIITRAVLKEAPLGIGKIGIAIYDNKPDDLISVTLEETVKVLGQALKEGTVADIAGEASTVGAFAGAAGAYAEGDYEGALRIMANEIANNTPLVSTFKKIGETAAEVVDHWVQDLWKNPELQKAFEVYATGQDKYGYTDVQAGNFNQVFSQMGPGLERQVRIDYVNSYCARRGCVVSQLSNSERRVIGDQGINALRQQWQARYERHIEISQLKEKNMDLFKQLEERGLLSLEYSNPMYTGNEDLEMLLTRLNNLTESIKKDLGRNNLADHHDWAITDPNSRDNLIPVGVLAELTYIFHNRRLNENTLVYDELIKQIGTRLENNEGLSVLEIMDLADELVEKERAGLLDSDDDAEDEIEDEIEEGLDDALEEVSEDEMSDPAEQGAPEEFLSEEYDLEIEDPENNPDFEWDDNDQCWQFVGSPRENYSWNCQSQCFNYRGENWHYDCGSNCPVYIGSYSDRWAWNCATNCWENIGPNKDRWAWDCATNCWVYVGPLTDYYRWNCSTDCWDYIGPNTNLWRWDCGNNCLQYIGPPVEGYEWSCGSHQWIPIDRED